SEKIQGSTVDVAHGGLGVARAGSDAFGRRLLERPQVGVAEVDLQRADILIEIAHVLGPENRHDRRAARQYPRERELRQRAPRYGGNRLQPLDNRQVAGEVLLVESWVIVAAIAGLDIGRFREAARGETAAERRCRPRA